MSRDQRLALDAMLRKAPQPFEPVPVEQMREDFTAFMATFPIPAGVRRTPTELAGRPALLVEPEGDAQPGTILYFHGGGNVFGSPETALQLTANLVARTGFGAFSLDYRLAPEHPFPAGADDALNAYRALLDSGEDPSAIAFAGDSRGGGHAVTACLAARDAGLPVPAAIVAFSPGLDYTPGPERAWTPRRASTPSSPASPCCIPRLCTWRGRTRTSRCSPPLSART